MVNSNQRISDQVVLAATIDPDAYGTGAQNSDWVDMGNFEAVLATVYAGTLGASATLDAKLQQATDGSGTGAKDITGKAITQLVKATDDDAQAIIECRSEELDVANGFTHVRLVVTVGTAASDASATIHGVAARYMADNLSSVAQRVF